MNYVIVDTDKGSEVWSTDAGGPLVAIFVKRSDADLFVACAGVTTDRIRNAAFNIASAFPALNLSNAPINPNSELVLKIMRIIESDCAAATTSPEKVPNYALVRLLNAAMMHPEQAEGYIRQVVAELDDDSPETPESGDAWRTWFDRMGDKASAEVVNATADLVTNERLAALVQVGVLPGEEK